MYKQLISEQRYTIFILLQNGTKKKDIAKAINVSPSTISREIKRNSGHTRPVHNWQRNSHTTKWLQRALAKGYFADPYSSWQKGAIENVNGLIRQYIPKNTCFSNISQQQITKIMQKINTRPRENSISQHQESAFTKRCCKFALASWIRVVCVILLSVNFL